MSDERCSGCGHTRYDLEPCPYGLHEFGCGGAWMNCPVCHGAGGQAPDDAYREGLIP